MKHRAVIMFADGSKQMAHNLDDTRFRWHERKIRDAEDIHHCVNDGFVIPIAGEKDSTESLLDTRKILVMQTMSLESQLSFSKTHALMDANERVRLVWVYNELRHQAKTIRDLLEKRGWKANGEREAKAWDMLKLENEQLRQRVSELEQELSQIKQVSP